MENAGIPGLADKLQHLFRSIPQPDGRGLYTNDAMVQELSARGVAATVQHLSSLRNGRRDNPSARLLAAIADVFGVSTDYFFSPDEERRVNDDIQTLLALRRTGGIRARGGIDRDGLAELLDVVRKIRRLEADDAGP